MRCIRKEIAICPREVIAVGKAKMLHRLLNGMASKLVTEIMIPKNFVHLL